MNKPEMPERRSGEETRALILSVALDLFIHQGYDGTSTRDISEKLGMTKSSLYYHFKNKEEILTTLILQRRQQLDDLLEWLKAQPPAPDLLNRTIHRWIGETTPERLKLMIVAQSNQPMMTRLRENGQDIREGFDEIIQHFAGPDQTFEAQLLVRMTFDTLIFALKASRGMDIDYDSVLNTAYQTSTVLSELAVRALRPE